MKGITSHYGHYSSHKRSLMIDLGHLSALKEVALPKIKLTFSTGNTRYLSRKSVQYSVVSMGYRHRKSTWVFLLASLHWTSCLIWSYGIAN